MSEEKKCDCGEACKCRDEGKECSENCHCNENCNCSKEIQAHVCACGGDGVCKCG